MSVVGEIEASSKLLHKRCLDERIRFGIGQKLRGKLLGFLLAVAGSTRWDKVFGGVLPAPAVLMCNDVVGVFRPCAAIKTATANGYYCLA